MSLILDALSRSRQDTEQVPGLAAVHPVEEVDPDAHWLLWLMVSMLVVAVLAIAWLLFNRLPQQTPVPAADPVEQTQPAKRVPDQTVPAVATTAVPETAPVTAAKPVREPRPEPRSRPEPAPVKEPAREPVSISDRAITEVKSATPPGVGERVEPVDEGVAALYQQSQRSQAAEQARVAAPSVQRPPERPATTSRVEETVDLEKLVAQAEAELRDARVAEHAVPMLSTMSQQTKDSIPTLMYLQHDYSGDSARSTVIINGKTLRAGGSVGGLKVEEILPDSVVLEFKGTRFRLRALNSWVNL